MGVSVLEWIPECWNVSENSARAAPRARHAAGKEEEQGIPPFTDQTCTRHANLN
jgi:hypothetical protein